MSSIDRSNGDSARLSNTQPASDASRSDRAGAGPRVQAAAGGRSPGELRDQAKWFKQLLSGPLTARELAALAARGSAAALGGSPLDTEEGDDGSDGLSGGAQHQDLDVSAMLTAQHAVSQGPVPQAAIATGAPDLTLAELIEKHIRRALSSQQAGRGSAAQELRLELSDAVLPGASLALRRTEGGWKLSATADNHRTLEQLNRYAPALVERFERASLGRLEIEIA